MLAYTCICIYTKNRISLYLKFFTDSLNGDQVIESLSCVPVHLQSCVCVKQLANIFTTV